MLAAYGGGEKVLDVACGHHAGWPEAHVLSDWGSFSKNYPGRTFIKSDIRKLPFKDQEFGFVIASHVLEHIPEVDQVMRELMRVAKAGYIETPAPLLDNLVNGNDGKHKWWVTFDDWNGNLVFRPRQVLTVPQLKIPGWTRIRTKFPESCVTSVYWSRKIGYKVFK